MTALKVNMSLLLKRSRLRDANESKFESVDEILANYSFMVQRVIEFFWSRFKCEPDVCYVFYRGNCNFLNTFLLVMSIYLVQSGIGIRLYTIYYSLHILLPSIKVPSISCRVRHFTGLSIDFSALSQLGMKLLHGNVEVISEQYISGLKWVCRNFFRTHFMQLKNSNVPIKLRC